MQFTSVLLEYKQQNLDLLAIAKVLPQPYFNKFNLDSNNPDIFLIDGTENNSIGIEQVHKFIAWSTKKPYQNPVKIGIIWPAEMLTIAAQNSLLKVIEEPKDATQIVLVAQSTQPLLKTITSRTIRYSSGVEPTNNEEMKLEASRFMKHSFTERRVQILKLAKTTRPQLTEFIRSLLHHYIKLANTEKYPFIKLKSLQICKRALLANKVGVNQKLILETLLYI